jgi:hypothetical protein
MEKVRAARPEACAMLLEGLDPATRLNDVLIIHRCAAVATDHALLRDWHKLDEHRLGELGDRLGAAYALGIAMGLLLRPEVFDGGER